MAKVCVKLTAAPEVGQFIPGVGTVTAIAGGPFENAECSKACCNSGQCVSKQIRYAEVRGSLTTPGATLCTAGLLPTPTAVNRYFYGSEAEFADEIPDDPFACPGVLPPNWVCCVNPAPDAGALCSYKRVYVRNDPFTGFGDVLTWKDKKTWDMGEI
jgi:hypothetical protein